LVRFSSLSKPCGSFVKKLLLQASAENNKQKPINADIKTDDIFIKKNFQTDELKCKLNAKNKVLLVVRIITIINSK
jgi:hypothetical protein